MERWSPSKKAWIALIGGIAVYNAVCPPGEQFSQGADRFIDEHPYLSRLAMGAIALHVMNLIPEQIDGVHYLSTLIGRKSYG